jgi:hypothetical protein
MKKQILSEAFRRMQVLAGIITESEMWDKDASNRDTYDDTSYEDNLEKGASPDANYYEGGFPSQQGEFSITHPLVVDIAVYLSEDTDTPYLSKKNIKLKQLHNVYHYGDGEFKREGSFELDFLKMIGINIPGLKKDDFVEIWIYPTEESWEQAERADEVEYIPNQPSRGEDFGGM